MENKVFRGFVEKKPGFDVAAAAILADITGFLGVKCTGLRLFSRYDVQGVTEQGWLALRGVVLSEPMSDEFYEETLPELAPTAKLLAYEALPGQFEQRADSCSQCIQMLLGGDRPLVRCARVLALEGVGDEDFARVAHHLINPVESGMAELDKPASLERAFASPPDVRVLEGFAVLDAGGLDELGRGLGLAMDQDDLAACQAYFSSEGRAPTMTELRVLDTYWSDHCRHTTFQTHLEDIVIEDARVERAYARYSAVRADRPVTLMDIALTGMRHLRKTGRLERLDLSDEVNACTVRVTADIDGRSEPWLLLFKNETHNHPTEIEPFGGAATCIGGAIRDPLSGRAYVYQAMRVTGAGDPRAPIEDTLPGKLPQRRLTVAAAEGYSSYGNQIGLATGYVKEFYHPGYVAKRLELGAVVGAAPVSHVRREQPMPGDLVLLLGGRTGRDGIGGATGSSKTHDERSVATCAAEVQKGNAPEERKLQRLFRNPEATRLIKRCNDFGAGGVSVAIGELADGLSIDLDAVPKKYDGLDGTELAISESQERMAVVVSVSDEPALRALAAAENLEATVVARVTDDKTLTMRWRGKDIVRLSRAFLDTNGAPKRARVHVPALREDTPHEKKDISMAEKLLLLASDLNYCSQKGLVERFDGSIGAGSVLMPHGGRRALTETQAMAALLPATGARTASVMACGFDPERCAADPFGGAVYSVVTSVAKLIASGAGLDDAYLSLQEYFPRPKTDERRWGLPFAALLGALDAQLGLGLAAIGGKDSMSGSFNELDVPPTLVSFAVTVAAAGSVLSPEFKEPGHPVYLFRAPQKEDKTPDYPGLLAMWARFSALCREGKIVSAFVCERGGAYGAALKMSLGNHIGFETDCTGDDLFDLPCGSIVAEAVGQVQDEQIFGYTTSDEQLRVGDDYLPLGSLQAAWEAPLESVFPTRVKAMDEIVPELTPAPRRAAPRVTPLREKPRAVIPVFPGTNCELDTARALEIAGGQAETVLIANLTPALLEQSALALEKAIRGAHMLILPGGFSGGDEPDGSGKYMVSFLRHARIADAIGELLEVRDGLALGICNGFQALIKLGLLPYGRITDMRGDCPTLTHNRIGRHQSKYVTTRVSSVLSPWLSKCAPGQLHSIPISHGEGRFAASPETLRGLAEAGQIAFQYVNEQGAPSMDIAFNPASSAWAVEGLCSPDGRVLGKMGHSERAGEFVAKNIHGDKAQPLLAGGVSYFRGK